MAFEPSLGCAAQPVRWTAVQPPPDPVTGPPPDDPESWSDEQWLAWLEATDDLEGADSTTRHKRARTVRGRPAHMLGAAMLGLRDAIYGRPDEDVVIVADASGDPPGDDSPQVFLDPEHPERSEVKVRKPAGGPRPGRTPPTG
jgi:hypothetical protein